MVPNPFKPEKPVGRQAELHKISQVLAADKDLLIAGVPGSGRRSLVHFAAQTVSAQVIEIDCLRATDRHRFLNLLAQGILEVFATTNELALIQHWSKHQPIVLEQSSSGQSQLVWHSSEDDWELFKMLLTLPQALAEGLDCRVVIVFQNFPHIRSWDRLEKWETYLRQEIQRQSQVSYALIATVAEGWVQQSDIQVVLLGPLQAEDLESWLVTTMKAQGLQFDPAAIALFLDYIQGNFGDALTLARRIWIDHQATENLQSENFQRPQPNLGLEPLKQAKSQSRNRQALSAAPSSRVAGTARGIGTTRSDNLALSGATTHLTKTLSPALPESAIKLPTAISDPSPSMPLFTIQAHHVHRSTLALVEDLALTFESLLLLLPSSQVRVLESLALDPTDSPHSREYIQKHGLSRGGGLQGALASLQQKGLVYGAEYGYRITMPLLAFWLKYLLA